MTDAERTDWRQLESFSFGDSPALADELAALVLAGVKTATCWAASDGALTHVGKRMIVLDGSKRPVAIIETVELTQRRFDEVNAAFAHSEGEGDRSLRYWREAHRRYFSRLGQFAGDWLKIGGVIAGRVDFRPVGELEWMRGLDRTIGENRC